MVEIDRIITEGAEGLRHGPSGINMTTEKHPERWRVSEAPMSQANPLSRALFPFVEFNLVEN